MYCGHLPVTPSFTMRYSKKPFGAKLAEETMTNTRPSLPNPSPSAWGAGKDGNLRRFVHWVDTWSKLKGRLFLLIVWLGSIGSLIWFVGSAVQNAAAESVYFALTSLLLFGGTTAAALLYEMLLVPYIRNSDRGLAEGRASLELLATAGELALGITVGSVWEGGSASSDSAGSRLSGGGSFGGGGASGRW